MKIGELASAAGTPPASIRFYETEGLLPPPPRTGSNYRDYTEQHLERLRFIRRCRSLDMELEEIRALLRLRDSLEADCTGVNVVLDAHIGHVGERIRELRALEAQLKSLRKRCDEVHGVERCGILRELSRSGVPVAPADAGHVRRAHR